MKMVMVPTGLHPFQRQLLGCELSSGVPLSALICVETGMETPGCWRGQEPGAPRGMDIESRAEAVTGWQRPGETGQGHGQGVGPGS